MALTSVITLFVLVGFAHSAPTKDVDHMTYLRNFGYLDTESSSMVDESDLIKNAISDFQFTFDLNVTGFMNSETKKAMKLRRCGCKDQEPNSSSRFHAQPYRVWGDDMVWNKTHLTYTVKQYTNQLTKLQVDQSAATALKFWSDVTKLTFERVSENSTADINIKFATGEHGDGNPFDGPGMLIGHGYPPDMGMVHFDDDEAWSVGKCDDMSINLVMVMTHEFGHGLGMAHSKSTKNVMYPNYRECDPNFALSDDDIEGIQSLYGKYDGPSITKSKSKTSTTTTRSTTTTSSSSTSTTTTTQQTPSTSSTSTTTTTQQTPSTSSSSTTTTTQQTPSTTTTNSWTPSTQTTTTKFPHFTPYICLHAEFEAYAFNDGHIRAFKDSEYYNINYVRPIKRLNGNDVEGSFEKAPANIEAALSINKRLLLFKGGIVYSYMYTGYSFELETGFPKPANQEFPGIPSYIDAAFEIRNQIYFVSNGKFFSGKMKSSESIHVYPTQAPVNGLPSRIDGAFADNSNDLYFFSGKYYYRINADDEKISEHGKISEFYFMCSKYMNNNGNL